jgi:two-component system response regulator MprA
MPPKTVLIVEDDEVIRDVLDQLFQYQGWKTLTAQHGREALSHLQGHPCCPALIVMDLMMPVMNGWELLEELRNCEAWSRIPIIVLSAGGEPHQLPQDGRLKFIKKPLRMNSLLEMVKTICP